MTSPKFPEEESKSIDGKNRPSTQAEMDRALDILSAHKDAWANMDISG